MALILSGDAGITFPVTAGSASAVQASSGRVLQVVQGSTTTTVSTASTSFIDTGLTASITPSSTTSKILVLLTQNGLSKTATNSQSDITVRLYRGASLIAVPSAYATYTNTAVEQYGYCSVLSILDSPATISSTTYKTQFNNSDGGGSGLVYVQRSSETSTLTLMEIAA